MVHGCGVFNGLTCAVDSLSRMTLQPKRPCQDRAGQIFALDAEIDSCGPRLSARPARQCCLKLHASTSEVAAQVERSTQNRTGQLDGDLIVHGPSKRGATTRVVQGCLEISRA